MGQRYDAIVIGAGIGGLSAAAYMAVHGTKVLVLEKHNVPGGYATSFVRGRFEFEVALHEMSGLGTPDNPCNVDQMLGEIGIADRIEFVRIPEFYRSVYPGHDITVPIGREAYEQALCDAFPAEADGIRRFFAGVFEIAADARYFEQMTMSGKRPTLAQIGGLPFHLPSLVRHSLATWEQVLQRYVQDPQARAVISQVWCYLGLPPSKVSYLFVSTAVSSYVLNGPAYIVGRSQVLSNAFVERIEELGGEVRSSCPVSRIVTRDGHVRGVITGHGEEIDADVVVSNLDPISTCRDLVGAEQVPDKFWKRLGSSDLGTSSFNVYLGLAKTLEELGIEQHEVFINDGYDPEEHYRRMSTIAPPGVITMTSYNAVWPEISPPGTSIVVLTSLMYCEPWLDVAPSEYVDTKNHIADGMIEMAESLIPGLRCAAEVVEVSTPLTNIRYVGQRGGQIYGFDNQPGDSTVYRLPHAGPLEGLFFVGACTNPGGGFEPSMITGRMVGQQVASAVRANRRGG